MKGGSPLLLIYVLYKGFSEKQPIYAFATGVWLMIIAAIWACISHTSASDYLTIAGIFGAGVLLIGTATKWTPPGKKLIELSPADKIMLLTICVAGAIYFGVWSIVALNPGKQWIVGRNQSSGFISVQALGNRTAVVDFDAEDRRRGLNKADQEAEQYRATRLVADKASKVGKAEPLLLNSLDVEKLREAFEFLMAHPEGGTTEDAAHWLRAKRSGSNADMTALEAGFAKERTDRQAAVDLIRQLLSKTQQARSRVAIEQIKKEAAAKEHQDRIARIAQWEKDHP